MPMRPLLQHWAACRAVGVLALPVAIIPLACSRPQTVPAEPSAPPLRIRAPAFVSPERPSSPVIPVDWSTEPWQPAAQPRAWTYIVIHHTATRTGSVESIHQTHLARRDADGNPWRGIGYHFVIGNGHGMQDGQIEATFRWRDQLTGAHAGDATYNAQGIGICLIGNFEQDPPTEAQLESLAGLSQSLSGTYDIPPQNIKGHCDVKSTACPGRYFPMQQLTQILAGEATSFDDFPAVP
jgi:hypothetical protein